MNEMEINGDHHSASVRSSRLSPVSAVVSGWL